MNRETETSFGGDDEDFTMVASASADPPPAEEGEEVLPQSAEVPLREKQPGLITRIGRSVKSVVGGAINIMFVGPSQDAKLDFVESCKKARKTLKKLHLKQGEVVFPNSALQAMIRTSEVLDSKDICISVFGQHNCGKSTLLNALIGEELLPVYDMSETSLKIKVQHDSNIHQGVCVRNCPNQHGSHQQSKSCPKLQVIFKEGEKEVKGAETIYQYLTQLNTKIRKGDDEPPVVVLKVNIPLLAGRVPQGWTVSLVDNPGFGEAKEHVVQLADASIVTSSAYIYLLQTENIGGTEVADFFKELNGKDKTALTDGRLAVGVTKFDTIYSNKLRKRGRRASPTTVEKVRETLITSIKEATGADIPDDTIIPLCGEWAMAASRLDSCLISDPNNEKQDRLEEAAEALENYPHLSLPGGQEQSSKDSIKSLHPKALIHHLERASGVADLKVRIHYVVGNACVKVWATKLISEFNNYLQAGEKGIEEKCIHLKHEIAAKRNDFDKAQDLYNEVLTSRENIKRTAPKRKKKKTSLWIEFEISYHKDLEKYKPQEDGKVKVRDLVKEFRDQCQAKITSRNSNFSPADFEKSIHEFLNDSGPKLQRVFDSSCGFWNVQTILMKHIEFMVEDISKLRSNARLLCQMGPEEVIEPHRRETMSESEGSTFKAPNLADIKLKVKIPSVSLSWWEKILSLFGYLNVSEVYDQERSEESERDNQQNEDSSSLSLSPSASLSNQISVVTPEKRGDDSDDSESDSSSDEECENISTEVDVDATPLSNTQDPSNSIIESESNADHCSTSMAEDEADGGGNNKQGSYRRTSFYRKWTKELEATICDLQKNMEMECDNYFETIMPKAIKFFYKDYSRRTHDRLETFDKDFSGPLEQEHRRLKELKSDIDSLQKDYYELQAKKIDIKKLAQQLLDAYSAEFAGHL